MDSQICDAINNRNLLEFYYDGGARIVEPHCYGITKSGNEALRAYQVGGYSSSGSMGWKMFELSKSRNLKVLDENFSSPRQGYKKGDKSMRKIYCEL